jgi:gamma-carbonic anhydrase
MKIENFKKQESNRISSQATIVKYNNMFPEWKAGFFAACGARVIGNVTLGENVSVWFNAVVRGDVNSIEIGNNTNIQDGAVVHCTFQKFSTKIGNNVSIAHQATIHGCTIEDNCLIGMQAVVMDGAVVGSESIVGAGAVITQGTLIPPRSLVLGAPAKVIRAVTQVEIDSILATTARYLKYTEGYSFEDANHGRHVTQ